MADEIRTKQAGVTEAHSEDIEGIRVKQAGVTEAHSEDIEGIRTKQAGVTVVWVSTGKAYAEGCSFGNGGESEVVPVRGDRAAWNTDDAYDEDHAKDIDDDSLVRHLPRPDTAGDYPRANGAAWIPQSGIPLADLLSYVRGYIVRGGAADWEAYDASGNRQFLVGDGTDLVSRVLANGDLPDPLAFNNAPTTLTLSGGTVTATQNLHIIAAETGTTDDLDTINGLADRQLLLIQADTGDTITVKHGTGNIHFDSDDYFELSGDSWLLLFYDGTHAVALGSGYGTQDASETPYTPTTNTDWDGDADPGNVDDALDQLAERADDNETAITTLETGRVVLLFTQTVTESIVNTTTETNLLNVGRGSKTIPAGTLQSGDVIRIHLTGQLSDTGTPSPTIGIELGGTSLASVTPTLTGITDVDWHMDIIITCRLSGASGEFLASGLFDYDEGSEISLESAAVVNVDTTAALEVSVPWTWDVADASNDIDCRQATVEHLSVENLAPVAPTELTATETV